MDSKHPAGGDTTPDDVEKDAFALIEPEPPVEWAVFLIDNPRKAKRVEAETFMAARTIGAWRFELFEKQGWRDRDAPKVPDTSRVWAVRPRDGETGRDAIARALRYLKAHRRPPPTDETSNEKRKPKGSQSDSSERRQTSWEHTQKPESGDQQKSGRSRRQK